jgi:hypothetical protein
MLTRLTPDAPTTIQEEPPHAKTSYLYTFFSFLHVALVLCFLGLIIYALASINADSAAVFAMCDRTLWDLLLVHLVLPFILGLVFLVASFTLSPFLLACTHQNPFWLMLVPLLIVMGYSSTMLGLTVQSILRSQQSDQCIAVLREPTRSISPDTPLIIILSWVFVAIDSLASLGELCFLVFLVGIQLYAFPVLPPI